MILIGSNILYTNNILNAEEEIKKLGARLTHQFSTSVIVINFSTSVDDENLEATFINSNRLQQELNETEKRLIKAWKSGNENIDKSFNRSQAPSRKGIIPPDTSRYMNGKIAIGLVIVSGPSQYEHGDDEKDKILQEVLKATDFLANAEPRAQITFMYNLYYTNIIIDPKTRGTSDDEYEKLESPWRDSALKKLGYVSGDEGINKLTHQIRNDSNSKWAYVSFFTKYPIFHFAYASRQHIVMEYKNGEWGPNRIHGVFAHETCHLFGAYDEYGEHNGDPSGTLQVINGNAEKCDQIRKKESCLMKNIELKLCVFSRGQLGWFWDLPYDQKKKAQETLLDKLYTTEDEHMAENINSLIVNYKPIPKFRSKIPIRVQRFDVRIL